jgi:hypothetical protein
VLFAVHAIIVEFQDSGRGRYGKTLIKIGPFGTICNIHCWYYNPLATSFNGVGNMPTVSPVAGSIQEHHLLTAYRNDYYSNIGTQNGAVRKSDH